MSWGARASAAAAGVLAVAGLAAGLLRPGELVHVQTGLTRFAPGVLEAAHAYQLPRDVGGLLAAVLAVAVPLVVVLTPGGRRLIRWLAGTDGTRWRAGLVAAAVAAAVSLSQLPVAVWLGYVHDTRWGFNAAGVLGWARDWLVSAGLGWTGAFVAGAGLLACVRRWPASWHWRAALLGTALVALLTLAYPLVIAPLFYRTETMPPGPVRAEVRQVLRAAGEGGAPILVGDASRRTTKLNAFVSGLGPTREIVVFDNLLSLPADQIAVVVAHELAHREHNDLVRSVLLASTGLTAGLLVLRRVWDAAGVRRLVGARGPADPRLIAVAVAIAAVLQAVAQPAAMAISREAEAAADARALELTGDPGAMSRLMRAFTVRDLVRPRPPLQWWWGSHPSVHTRIEAAAGFAAAEDLPLPELARVRRAERDLRHPTVDLRPKVAP